MLPSLSPSAHCPGEDLCYLCSVARRSFSGEGWTTLYSKVWTIAFLSYVVSHMTRAHLTLCVWACMSVYSHTCAGLYMYAGICTHLCIWMWKPEVNSEFGSSGTAHLALWESICYWPRVCWWASLTDERDQKSTWASLPRTGITSKCLIAWPFCMGSKNQT